MAKLSTLALGLAALAAAGAAPAQPRDDGWLDSAPARGFRMRVAQLAVIYGDARGIDPHGLVVTGRRVADVREGCADVEVVVLAQERELRQERLRACRHAAGS